MLKSKYKFYFLLFTELLFWPFLWLRQQVIMLFGTTVIARRMRQPIIENKILVVIHEWGGYEYVRIKTIKDGATFECGLKGQLDRFANKPNVELYVTMSDANRHHNIEEIGLKAVLKNVCNEGMDFSGYSTIHNLTKDGPNRYVILTNSSVNSIQEEFLEGYIEYMNMNPDVGVLGVSYCTKMMQTLVRNNFTPHIQSFFLLTTMEVLNEIVKLNHGKFPGCGIDHKLLLIRKGEILFSQLAIKAGYRLAVVNPQDGIPYKFDCHRLWKLPFGDIRQKIITPNRITPIRR